MNGIDSRELFYLGREYDLKAGRITDELVMYPARHLTTHAILLGMTGSGKTGLGIILLEEALLQGIPVLAVDPKGDIANLLLTFPDLAPQDFEPWIDTDRAESDGLSAGQAAAQTAERWQKGLSDWGIEPKRISRLRRMAEFTLFTPGSSAGTPVDVLHRFQTPSLDWDTYEEVMRERIQGLVTALLGLAGREADPLQSPEHVLLSHIVEHVWRAGDPLDLPALIRLIQEPPIHQIGVFDLESFLPGKDRTALARALNNILAAPGFGAWRDGVPLEIGDLLYTPENRPRANVFYLPHLDDAGRDFFITLLLEAVIDWMSAQPGTSDLRAVLYFDEVFGFFPPHPANPPTKEPLLSLIKRGRAAGLGVVLSTQNPADLDYKGLTNAGTWAIGTLRTERDKYRVLEGLEGATAAAGSGFDRRSLDKALGTLKPRVFLLNDIRADEPVFMHTRWAMSYLRGPLTRAQVRKLCEPEPRRARVEELPAADAAVVSEPALESESLSVPPSLPTEISQVYVPATVSPEWSIRKHEDRTGEKVLAKSRQFSYVPRLLAMGTAYLVDERKGVDQQVNVVRLIDPEPPPSQVDWAVGGIQLGSSDLSREPVGEGSFLPVEPHLAKASSYKNWSKAFSEYIYRNIRLSIWHNAPLKMYGEADESRRDFRVRCEKEARRRRDAEVDTARSKVEAKMKRLQQRLRREKRELAQDEAEAEGRKREQLLSYGETALNLLTGRRPSYMISSMSRRRRLLQQAEADIDESVEAIEDIEGQLEDLAVEWEDQAAEINGRWAATLDEFEQVDVAPRRKDVVVDFCGLAWFPVWDVATDDGRRLVLPAYESDDSPE